LPGNAERVTVDLAETLPLAQRLALSYAPRAARGPALALMALDQRLGAILRAGGEPALAQIKLAWWRERLGQSPALWPEGEPLLALLRGFPGGPSVLAEVVDGWEILLADHLDAAEIVQFADGRATGWRALGGEAAARAARQWALTDLMLNLPAGDEAEAVRAVLTAGPWPRARLPRDVRPLAVLHMLSRRAIRRGSAELLDGPRALVAAMRVGIFGG